MLGCAPSVLAVRELRIDLDDGVVDEGEVIVPVAHDLRSIFILPVDHGHIHDCRRGESTWGRDRRVERRHEREAQQRDRACKRRQAGRQAPTWP